MLKNILCISKILLPVERVLFHVSRRFHDHVELNSEDCFLHRCTLYYVNILRYIRFQTDGDIRHNFVMDFMIVNLIYGRKNPSRSHVPDS